MCHRIVISSIRLSFCCWSSPMSRGADRSDRFELLIPLFAASLTVERAIGHPLKYCIHSLADHLRVL